jgi:hypothetical protein
LRDAVTRLAAAGCLLALATGARAQLGLQPAQRSTRRPTIAQARPIEWVEGLEKARELAGELGRPLFIYFHGVEKGSRLLEAGAVNSPQVQIRAPRFVCVKVDPEVDPEAATLYGLTMQDAVVLADFEGNVLGKIEGSLGAEALAPAMDRAVREFGPIPNRNDLAQLAALLRRSERYREAGRLREAIRDLSRMVGTGARCESVRRARAALDSIEAEGAKAVVAAEALLKAGKRAEAAAALEKLAEDREGTAAAERAKELLKTVEADPGRRSAARAEEIAEEAKRLWEAVEAARARKRLDDETDVLRKLAALGPGEDADRAKARLEEIDSTPELRAGRAAQRREREASMLLKKARAWIRNKQTARARKFLRELVQRFPDTLQAEEAKEILESIE